METPNQLLERLEKMGEQRVRGLLANPHFDPKALPLIQNWLSGKQPERDGGRPAKQELDEALEKARALARQAGESAKKASEVARKANRMAFAALAAGSLGLLVSILALFVLALR